MSRFSTRRVLRVYKGLEPADDRHCTHVRSMESVFPCSNLKKIVCH